MKRICFLLIILFSLNIYGFEVFFGNIHAHTSYSDGQETPQTAYNHAKCYVDVQGITDHAYYFTQLVNGNDKLLLTKRAAIDSTKDGSFVALWGFEWTGGVGHINVYGTNDWISRNESSLQDLYEWIVSHKALAQFNHPISKFGTFYDFEYDPRADEFINLCEVGNGNWAIGDTISDEMISNYILALNRGWHLGATANQDNHAANWGSANDTRTAILAEKLTYDSIVAALMDRHTYATEDRNALMSFTGNGQLMGSVLYDATRVELLINLTDLQDPFQDVQVVSQSGVVAKFEANSDSFSKRITVTVPDGYEWYYVLARQRDGDILVSSPIWVQDSLAVYAHSLKVSENPSEKAVNVSFHLVNLNSEKVKVNVRIQLETTWKDVAVELLGYEKRTISTSFKEFKSGENHVKIFVNERLIQSTVHQVSYLEGPTVLVDVSHENSFQDMWTTIANDVPMKLQFNKKFFKTVPTADIVILPLPAEKGFNELKELMPFEISNLVSYVKNGGKIVIIPGDDKDHIQTYNDLLDHLGLGELVVENDKIVLRYDKDGEYKENVVFLPFQDVASLTESLLELLRGELP